MARAARREVLAAVRPRAKNRSGLGDSENNKCGKGWLVVVRSGTRGNSQHTGRELKRQSAKWGPLRAKLLARNCAGTQLMLKLQTVMLMFY